MDFLRLQHVGSVKSTKDEKVANGLMSSAKRRGKKHVNGGENLGARNVRRVKAGIGCSMLSVGSPSETS